MNLETQLQSELSRAAHRPKQSAHGGPLDVGHGTSERGRIGEIEEFRAKLQVHLFPESEVADRASESQFLNLGRAEYYGRYCHT